MGSFVCGRLLFSLSLGDEPLMNITVTDEALSHFWDEPPQGNWEFWSFRWKPKAQLGDKIYFLHNKTMIATAVIAKIEAPGQSKCELTGKHERGWKVFWTPESFEELPR